jgi:RNA polymerase sigma-70 factor, ECF subfamily
MTTTDPSATFEPHRRRLLGLAYRMLGSMAEAEDAVQEAYLRWHDTDRAGIAEPRAFLMTTTTRICLDVLKSARVRREAYVGPWLPDPVIDTASLAPDAQTELAEDLSIALLLALDRLSPLERAAFLLHDVFDYSFAQVSATLGRSEAACRQLAARARARVRESRPATASVHGPSSAADDKHARLVTAFMTAARSGDVAGLTRLLASDVRVVSDGGGKVPAALNVLEGADRVVAFLVGAVRRGWTDGMSARSGTINGLPGLIVSGPDGVIQTNAFEIDNGLIGAIYVVRNPDKLRHVAVS